MTEAEKALEQYIERYSVKHKITPEEAKKHQMVKEVEDFYKEKYKNIKEKNYEKESKQN